MALPDLIEEAITAHGGRDRWARVRCIEATISAGGLLFATKRRRQLVQQRMRAWAREPRFAFDDFPVAGETAELIGEAEVRITSSDGTLRAQRLRPRDAFSGLRRSWRSWDTLDFVYFAGYATWHYLVTPFVFLRGGFRFEPLPDLPTADGPWRGIRAFFPPDLPSHCPVQDFWFEASGLLRRLDYTAEVVGGWAHAAHRCDEHRSFDGLVVPTRRTVTPLPFGRRPLPLPVLVALQVHELRVLDDES